MLTECIDIAAEFIVSGFPNIHASIQQTFKGHLQKHVAGTLIAITVLGHGDRGFFLKQKFLIYTSMKNKPVIEGLFKKNSLTYS